MSRVHCPAPARNLATAVLFATLGVAAQAAPVYRLTLIPSNDQVAPVAAADINSAGVVVGYGQRLKADGSPSREPVAFRFENGVVTRLKGRDSGAAAVNEHNEVVGSDTFWNAQGKPRSLGEPPVCAGRLTGYDLNDAGKAVGQITCTPYRATAGLFKATQAVDLGVLPEHDGATAHAINNRDQIVGVSVKSLPDDFITRGFIWENGQMRDLGTLGGASSTAYAINQQGHVTGNAEDAAGVDRPFLHDGVSMSALPACGDDYTQPHGINNHDQVVGALFGGQRHGRAILIEAGQCYRLQALLDESGEGWTLWNAGAINDDGTIVGTGKFQGEQRAFIATRVSP